MKRNIRLNHPKPTQERRVTGTALDLGNKWDFLLVGESNKKNLKCSKISFILDVQYGPAILPRSGPRTTQFFPDQCEKFILFSFCKQSGLFCGSTAICLLLTASA